MERIQFYALKPDLISIIQKVELDLGVTYMHTFPLTQPQKQPFDSALNLPNLGLANADSSIGCDSYLIALMGYQFIPRVVQLKAGGSHCFYDQLSNEDTVVFRPAGLYVETGEVFYSELSTLSRDKNAQLIMRRFYKVIKKQFVKHDGVWLGAEVLNLLKSGGRLTAASQAPYALSIPK